MNLLRFALLAAGGPLCAGHAQDHAFSWNGDPAAVVLGDGARRPEPLERGLRFRSAVASLATLDAGVLPRVEGALTIRAELTVDRLPRDKAGIVGRWQLTPGGRSFELGLAPDGRLFFSASASGRWPEQAREIRSPDPLPVGRRVVVGCSFDPGVAMALLVGGEVVRATGLGVPPRLFPAELPIRLGGRAGGGPRHGFDGVIAGLWITERAAEVELAPVPSPPHDLDRVRAAAREWAAALTEAGRPYGAYSLRPGEPADLYASADLAWIRWMCDDLELTAAQRAEWLAFIVSCRNDDGSYRHGTGHCPTHAFCHATAAVHMLGGDRVEAPALLEPYLDSERVPAWLDAVDWTRPWGASHDVWGAGLPIACSAEAPAAWRAALFAWLDREVDPADGCWRRGVATRTRLERLGGAFHIWPIYAALGRPLPHPRRIVDFVLSLQHGDGSFDGGFGYGHMDGVWVLAHLVATEPHRRPEVEAALARATAGLLEVFRDEPGRFFTDAHSTLSRIAALAIAAEATPQRFRAARPWRNPWSRRELFAVGTAARRR